MTTLSLEASKKVFEITTGYTEKLLPHQEARIPRLTFSGVVRVVPEIGKKLRWSHGSFRNGQTSRMHMARMCKLYAYAETEAEGMEAVENYLLTLLKKEG